MKETLQNLIKNDASYNKNVTRYLYRTHPDLWQQVLTITSFLPDDAVPKQRVWHILNDIWQIPICLESGQPVKWHENRYLSFASQSASSSYLNKAGLLKNHNPETNKKRSETVKKNYRSGKHKKVEERNIDYVQGSETRKKTNLQKYGVDNPSKNRDILKKIYDTQIKNGSITPKEKRSDKRRYYDAVEQFTSLSWKVHFDKINPDRLDRSSGWELDHIYSKHKGFNENIPPYIIGHWTNLQMLSKSENSAKREKCHKTQDQLFEDFFNN